MSNFYVTLVPALLAYGVGVIIAWFIWGGDRSNNR
jgi:hypothetical protein